MGRRRKRRFPSPLAFSCDELSCGELPCGKSAGVSRL